MLLLTLVQQRLSITAISWLSQGTQTIPRIPFQERPMSMSAILKNTTKHTKALMQTEPILRAKQRRPLLLGHPASEQVTVFLISTLVLSTSTLKWALTAGLLPSPVEDGTMQSSLPGRQRLLPILAMMQPGEAEAKLRILLDLSRTRTQRPSRMEVRFRLP